MSDEAPGTNPYTDSSVDQKRQAWEKRNAKIAADSPKETNGAEGKNGLKLPNQKFLMTVVGIAAALAVVVSLAIAGSGGTNPPTSQTSNQEPPASEPELEYSEFSAAVALADSDLVNCSQLKKIATNTEGNKKWKARIKSAKKASKNPYSAHSYAKKRSWTDSPGTALTNWETKWNKAISSTYEQVLTDPELDSSQSSQAKLLYATFQGAFEDELLDVCNLSKKHAATRTLLSKVSTAGAQVVAVAATKPWYPKGYSPLGSELAINWVERGHDCYSCYQWDAKVVSQYGCPTSLYIEMNIETSGGTVVDWTNDVVSSLAPGQKANMRFQSYLDGYGTLSASITDYSCY